MLTIIAALALAKPNQCTIRISWKLPSVYSPMPPYEQFVYMYLASAPQQLQVTITSRDCELHSIMSARPFPLSPPEIIQHFGCTQSLIEADSKQSQHATGLHGRKQQHRSARFETASPPAPPSLCPVSPPLSASRKMRSAAWRGQPPR